MDEKLWPRPGDLEEGLPGQVENGPQPGLPLRLGLPVDRPPQEALAWLKDHGRSQRVRQRATEALARLEKALDQPGGEPKINKSVVRTLTGSKPGSGWAKEAKDMEMKAPVRTFDVHDWKEAGKHQ
ncbi:MAG: hypothetical protein AB1641_09195 [Thermodesulfobacteriota bacterium]